MKRLLLTPLLLTLLLASCSYKKKFNSFREASDACKEWAEKGDFYIVKTAFKTLEEYGKTKVYRSLRYEVPLRSCEEEMQTKQVLGIEIINRNAKEVYTTDTYMTEKMGIYGKGFKNDKKEVKKNFYF